MTNQKLQPINLMGLNLCQSILVASWYYNRYFKRVPTNYPLLQRAYLIYGHKQKFGRSIIESIQLPSLLTMTYSDLVRYVNQAPKTKNLPPKVMETLVQASKTLMVEVGSILQAFLTNNGLYLNVSNPLSIPDLRLIVNRRGAKLLKAKGYLDNNPNFGNGLTSKLDTSLAVYTVLSHENLVSNAIECLLYAVSALLYREARTTSCRVSDEDAFQNICLWASSALLFWDITKPVTTYLQYTSLNRIKKVYNRTEMFYLPESKLTSQSNHLNFLIRAYRQKIVREGSKINSIDLNSVVTEIFQKEFAELDKLSLKFNCGYTVDCNEALSIVQIHPLLDQRYSLTQYDSLIAEQTKRRDLSFLKIALSEALGLLNDNERKVLEMRFFGEMSLEAIGKELNLTRERVRQIEAKALRNLRTPSRNAILKGFLDI